MRLSARLVVGGVIWSIVVAGAVAADPPPKPWTDVADFGFVATSGNAQGTRLGDGRIDLRCRRPEERVDDAFAFELSPDAGAPVGTPDTIYTLEKTDMILAVALVVNF